MAQTIAIERVDHIGIRVRDLERALAFYRALGFTLAHRAVGDDVAIVRNEHGVELNLIFNANAGDPDSNILMDVPDKFPGLHAHGTARRFHPGDHRISQGERYRDYAGAGQLWRKRTGLRVRARPRSQRDRATRPRAGRGRGRHSVRALTLRVLLRGDAFPGDLTVFLDIAGPPGWRDQDHALAFKTHPAHLIAADPVRV